jgi:hypothetical protein
MFLKGKDPDGRRSAPSLPKNHTPLQVFKERVLTDFGGAAITDSNENCFYRFLPVTPFLSEIHPG